MKEEVWIGDMQRIKSCNGRLPLGFLCTSLKILIWDTIIGPRSRCLVSRCAKTFRGWRLA